MLELIALKETIITYSANIILALLIFIIARILISVFVKLITRFLRKLEVGSTVHTLIIDLFKFVLWVLTLAIILNILGLKEISLALGGSVAVMALGLSNSVANIAGDLLAGIFLLSDEDFKVGASVKIGSVEGIVESLEIRKTKIRDANGHLHIISNRNVDNNVFVVKNQKK